MKRLILSLFFLFNLQSSLAQRHVVLLIADDLGTDYFGFYEGAQDTVDVPHIRALLNNGVRFTNAMSNPYCSATRAGILTGRYSFRTNVGGVVGAPTGAAQLDTSEITFPQLLEIYNPAIAKANIGKWHLHNPMPASNLMNPQVLGYDHFEGPFIGAISDYNNWTKYTNGVQSTVTTYATTEHVNNAVSWLQQQNGKPFFLWSAFVAPHTPFHLPPASLHNYNFLPGTPAHINQNPKLYFKAMIQSLDTEIGRLMDSLQAMNVLDSTDFIFIGDNGNTGQTAQVAPPNKAKGTIYQYGVHVPMIISGPSVVNPGRSSDALVNTADVFATVLELFGYNNWQSQIPVNKPTDSKSLMPIILNQSTQVRPWAFTEVFDFTPDSAEGKAMRNEQYKLIHFDYGAQEFYDLLADTFETNNLLNGVLTATELSNYQYLCSEMSNLLGSGIYCDNSVGINEVLPEDDLPFPNPFESHIYLSENYHYDEAALFDCFGRMIYQGNDLSSQNFSELPAGVYGLRIRTGENARSVKVVKRR